MKTYKTLKGFLNAMHQAWQQHSPADFKEYESMSAESQELLEYLIASLGGSVGELRRSLSEENLAEVIKCPECLEECSQDELNMFQGFCEECSGAFD